MASTVRRPSYLALAGICLVVLHLFARATTGMLDNRTTHAALLFLASDAPPMNARWPWPAFSHRLRTPSALSNATRTRCIGFSAASPDPEDATTSATTATSTPRAPPLPRLYDVNEHAAATLPAPRSVTAAYKKEMAPLNALPLLAIPVLPPAVAALVALASLTTQVRARTTDCFKLNHATCSIYAYDNETATIDRSRIKHRWVCLHPLCHSDSDTRLYAMIWAYKQGRVDDLLHIYCTVRTLEGDLSILPWRNAWRVHLPIADPGAAAVAGGDICYVELAHLGYREGYYIHCPVGDHHLQTYCTEFPEEEIAAAVWEHRSHTYRATVGPRYATYQDKYNHDEL